MTLDALHPRHHALVLHASRWCAAAVMMIALLVFAGWIFDVELLRSLLHPARVAMNPATASAFLLLGAALWLSREETAGPSRRRTVRLLATLVGFIALARLGGYWLGWETGIDRLMFRSRLGENVMAPNTAVTFLILGLAMLLLDVRIGRIHPAQGLVILAAGVALFSITGYLYRATSLYGVRGYIPMALNTAICFAILCVGMLAARPGRQPVRLAISDTLGGAMARRLIPPAFLVPLLLGWLHVRGRRMDLLDDSIGMPLLVLSVMVVFNLLIWWCARVMHESDLGHRRAEAELRQSEERHRAIMEQSAEGIYLVDLETRRVLDCNAAMYRLLGYSESERRIETVYDIVQDAPERVDARLQRLIDAAGPLHGEREYRRRDGTAIEVESTACVISYGGRRVACSVVHDITARKRAERELLEKHKQLEEALNQLKLAQSQLVQSEKLASLGQMVAGVAHEINNPLAFVSNNVAVLQRDAGAMCDLLKLYTQADTLLAEQRPPLAKQIQELAERIDVAYTTANMKELTDRSREGLRRIQQIVKDLRDFARLDQADVHDADLNAGIESTINIIAGVARKKQITIEKDLAPLPPITCQPAKINQVVMNLLSNAIDASADGSTVRIRSSTAEGTLRIEVIDHGCGIDPAARQRLFDPFFTTKPPGAGTGLGLSISYGIVKDHGGTIDVDSAPGKGSTFTIRLPLRRP